jgi:two-component system response regulator YesN
MPKADGIEVLRRIKTLLPECRVIILTGVNSQQLATKALDSGAFDFIGKPFDVVDLREKVARAIAHVEQNSSPVS